jgi:hypothetical protein
MSSPETSNPKFKNYGVQGFRDSLSQPGIAQELLNAVDIQ